jgi:peptide/nickel transport system substrate-binding protein
MDPGKPAEGRELELLQPFAAELPPGAIEGYALPVSDGDQTNRKNIRAAAKLLEEAGWTVGDDGILKNAKANPSPSRSCSSPARTRWPRPPKSISRR